MHPRAALITAVATGLAAGVSLGALGCGGGTTRRAQLASDNPMDRATAIVQVYEARDQKAIQKLVDLLDDSSSAVRLYAILALRGLTGEDFGYRYYENDIARAASVRRWRDAVRSGIVVLRAAPPTIPPSEAAPSAVGPLAGGEAGS